MAAARRELGSPRLVANAHADLASANTLRRRRKHPDRTHDQPLAAEPDGREREHADCSYGHVGNRFLGVHVAQNRRLVEAHGKARLDVGQLHETEHAPNAIQAAFRDGAFSPQQQVRDKGVIKIAAANPFLRLGIAREHGSRPVRHEHDGSRPAGSRLGHAADPAQIHQGNEHRVGLPFGYGLGIGGEHVGKIRRRPTE